jgi:hypothetical protein
MRKTILAVAILAVSACSSSESKPTEPKPTWWCNGTSCFRTQAQCVAPGAKPENSDCVSRDLAAFCFRVKKVRMGEKPGVPHPEDDKCFVDEATCRSIREGLPVTTEEREQLETRCVSTIR